MQATARVEHRDYVSYNWVAVKFCRVEFHGKLAGEMKKKWRKAENELINQSKNRYQMKLNKVLDLRREADEILKEVKSGKPFYRFWYNEAERKRVAKARKLHERAEKIEASAKEYPTAYETYRCVEKFLQQEGFVLMHTESRGKECITKTELWKLE